MFRKLISQPRLCAALALVGVIGLTVPAQADLVFENFGPSFTESGGFVTSGPTSRLYTATDQAMSFMVDSMNAALSIKVPVR